MEFLKKRKWIGLLLLLPLLMANKQCKRDTTWGDFNKELIAPWAADHKNIDEDTKCSDCHDGRTTKSRPKSHNANWAKEHGSFVTSKYGFKSENVCSLCHEEAMCVKCHQQEAPANHNNFWRLKGHASMAAMDRQRCAVCHQGADFCERCHSQTPPQDHVAGWGTPSNLHCVTCHLPVQSVGAQTCATCHSATPSHDQAPRRPSNGLHLATAPCLDCHTSMRHPNNGTSCITCHTQ